MLLYLVIGVAAFYFLTKKSNTKLLDSFRPSGQSIENDFIALRKDLDAAISTLIPWGDEELRLLSFKQQKTKKSQLITTVRSGVFTTIYDEPVLAYSLKKYASSKTNIIVTAHTSDTEFQFHIFPEETQIRIDKQAVGILKANGMLYPLKGSSPLARIAPTSASDLSAPIYVSERLVASMTLEGRSRKINPRVFEEASSQLSSSEEKILLAIAIPTLLKSQF